MVAQIDYRVAFILPRSRELLGRGTPKGAELPIVNTPMYRRPAEQLTAQIEAQWKIKTIVLDLIPDLEMDMPCAVVEVRTPYWNFEANGFQVVDVAGVEDSSMSEYQRTKIKSLLTGCVTNERAFSRIGWIEEAQEWIQAGVIDHKVIFTEDVKHLNAGGTFCLVRLGTQSGPAYWIKGVGAPNAHEFDVTSYLAKHCPQYLPPVIAVRKDWNAWVMEEFGLSLHHSNALEDFKLAVDQLANLQKQLVGQQENLLAAGCADHRFTASISHR
jgi:hypothetical protein